MKSEGSLNGIPELCSQVIDHLRPYLILDTRPQEFAFATTKGTYSVQTP
jgi:hypothetical protein